MKNVKKDKNKRKRFRMKTDGFKFMNLCHNLKVLFIPWLTLAVFAVVVITGVNFFSAEVDSVTATIAFHYTGIESGLTPNGCEFDQDDIASPELISAAIAAEGLSPELASQIQDNIYISSVVSTNAINDITKYNSVYSSSTGSWIKNISDTSYHPTKFVVSLNYSHTDLTGEKAASLLNTILNEYKAHFIEVYGYSETISNTVNSVDIDSYDYLIALDMYSSDIGLLENYISSLAKDDTSDFRSEATGYSFSDLAESAALIRTVDIDTLTSYILNNGTVSDKDMILSYYQYRIDNITRQNDSLKYRLNETLSSIENYQKDSIIVYDGYDSGSTSITNTSPVYDDLIQEKLQLQDTISNNDRAISELKERITAVKKSSGSAAKADREYVDERIAVLQEKVSDLTDNIKLTADEYFKEHKFCNALTVTSSANYSVVQLFKAAVDESVRMIIISVLLLLTLYLLISIFFCMGDRLNRMKNAAKARVDK